MAASIRLPLKTHRLLESNHGHTSPTWGFFIFNNRCVVCHPTSQTSNTNNTMKFNNGLYNPFHYITNIKKHVANKHDVAMNQYKTQKKVVDEIVLIIILLTTNGCLATLF
jgi:hypothetical protein